MLLIGMAITGVALLIALPLIIGGSPSWLGSTWSGALQPVFVIGAVAIGIGAIIKIFQ